MEEEIAKFTAFLKEHEVSAVLSFACGTADRHVRQGKLREIEHALADSFAEYWDGQVRGVASRLRASSHKRRTTGGWFRPTLLCSRAQEQAVGLHTAAPERLLAVDLIRTSNEVFDKVWHVVCCKPHVHAGTRSRARARAGARRQVNAATLTPARLRRS